MTEMLPNIPTAIILLCIAVVVNLQTTPPTACDDGWFGENCQFQCHCQEFSTCDRDGDCLNNNSRCATGFFGPACQYVDLATKARLGAGQDMIDGNDDTCNSDPNAGSVRVSWVSGIVFTWLRLHVSNPRNLNNFTVKLNELLECPNEQKFPVSNITVDVTCDVQFLVLAVDVIGAVAPDVCSIYISGGRNVALKQATNQSSILSSTMGPASTAVDGNTDPIFSNGHCSHTGGEVLPRWSLYFEHPCSIYEIIIHNRISSVDHISGFVVTTYNEGGIVTFSHTELGNFTLEQFIIPLPWHDPISVIIIARPSPDGNATKYLVLCEVQAFGEAVCPDEYYGLSCNQKCTCTDNEVCSAVTGACRKGCPNGRYGYNCLLRCNTACRHLECHQRSGNCISCQQGFSGKDCSLACGPGTYGPNCRKNCSINCNTGCDVNDGFCVCKYPYVGKTCTECPATWYGDNCTEKCSEDCASRLCHTETGECASCPGAKIGAFCEECPQGFYGALCFQPCSRFCDNNTCDVESGACFSCTHDYTGPTCTDAPTSMSVMHLLVGVAVSALLSFVCTFFFLRKSQKEEGSESESYVTGTSTI